MEIRMEESKAANLKGQSLMAMSSLLNPDFYQTVNCSCEHNNGGAVGIILDCTRIMASFTYVLYF